MSHVGEMQGSAPEPNRLHRFQCHMLACLEVCPWPQRRHRYQRRLDSAAQPAEVHLRKRVTLAPEFEGVDDLESRVDNAGRLQYRARSRGAGAAQENRLQPANTGSERTRVHGTDALATMF